MKFDDLNEELNDDVLVTVDNEGFAELTDVYHGFEEPKEEELLPGAKNAKSLIEKLEEFTKLNLQSVGPMPTNVLDLIESFHVKTEPEFGTAVLKEKLEGIAKLHNLCLTPEEEKFEFNETNLNKLKDNLEEENPLVDELVNNSKSLKEKRDFARRESGLWTPGPFGRINPNTKTHIDAYLKKHTGNCSDNFVAVTRIGHAPITTEQRKTNEETELQRQRAEAVNQIAKISRFLLEQAENGKIAFASPPQPPSAPTSTVKEKVLGKLSGIKSKFKQVKKKLFCSVLACTNKVLLKTLGEDL